MTLAASTVNCRLCTATWLLRTHCSFYGRDVEDAGATTRTTVLRITLGLAPHRYPKTALYLLTYVVDG